ncbi:hypothetical protein COY34_03145 [candidate division WWE3 bacterium CG_4_10_14_0_2_um_filter_42_8]|uniref:Lycopene cyclase domain-containing protein n=1 Tax=candidate division WWE3 bacterium CG_4_10_14_0_2_um_filter_42_8 TaxID=1975074 RepID=A0A2M7TB16_UNCKA|nr:MAG: hypothetical protein COY34_03145 [candidate division WWE3 bacterium CG_4_10_14_0_2_um_filter_42_8]
MFGHGTYLFYTLIFTLPLIGFLWFFYRPILRPCLKKILGLSLLATFYGFLVWPYGLKMSCWGYSEAKILNITLFGVVLEDIVWWFLVTWLLISFVTVSLHFENRKQSFLASLIKNAFRVLRLIFPFLKTSRSQTDGLTLAVF